MKAAVLTDKVDDLLNPIAVKELRQAVKSRIIVSALILFLVIQLSILLINLSFGDRQSFDRGNWHAGRRNFLILQGILLGTCMLLVPAYAGVRLSAERSDSNVDLLFISTLRPRSIIAGKLQAAVVLILLIFSACAPFMTFTYLLRGIDIPSIVLVLALDFLIALLGVQGAIFLGSVQTTAGMRLLLGLFGLAMLVGLFSYTTAFCAVFLETDLSSRMDRAEFWWGVAVTAVLIVTLIGLLFAWSVAIVSPPSANRALPVRLYLLSFWLISGVMAALLTRHIRFPIPWYIWEATMVVLFCTQILVSINEREQWGSRIRRTIPRRWWLRGPAFLMYSGSAGGIFFAVLLIALTIGLANVPLHYWVDTTPFLAHLNNTREGMRHFTQSLVLLALYTFDYCILAVWLRNALLQHRLKASFNWVLAITLAGLGLALPWPLLFLFQSDELRTGRTSPWWQISNPLSTILTRLDYGNPDTDLFCDMSLMLLSVLGLLLLLGCGSWISRQIGRFRPPEQELAGERRFAEESSGSPMLLRSITQREQL